MRKVAGVSSRQLSIRAGLGVTTAAVLERSAARPGIDTVERIAAALGVDPCWLAFGSDGPQPFAQRVRRLIDPEPPPMPKNEGHPYHGLCELLPDRLRATREAKGLTMQAIADAASLSRQNVSDTENKVTVPLLANVEALAVALEVSPCWLAFGIGEPPRPRD